jgi:hypothetical protein
MRLRLQLPTGFTPYAVGPANWYCAWMPPTDFPSALTAWPDPTDRPSWGATTGFPCSPGFEHPCVAGTCTDEGTCGAPVPDGVPVTRFRGTRAARRRAATSIPSPSATRPSPSPSSARSSPDVAFPPCTSTSMVQTASSASPPRPASRTSSLGASTSREISTPAPAAPPRRGGPRVPRSRTRWRTRDHTAWGEIFPPAA